MKGCSSLEALPPSVGELGSLQELWLEGCLALRDLMDTLGGLSQMKTLRTWKCSSLEALPPSVGVLGSLQELILEGCDELGEGLLRAARLGAARRVPASRRRAARR